MPLESNQYEFKEITIKLANIGYPLDIRGRNDKKIQK